MTETPAGAATLRWVATLAWLLPPLFELPLLAGLCSGIPEVGRAAVFGLPATRVAVVFALLAALAGFVAVVRGATGLTRAAVAGALSIAAGIVAALAAGFLIDGEFPMIALLPAHSALALAVLARATLREPADSE